MRLGLISGKFTATESGTLMRLGNDRPEKSISKSDLGDARLWRIDKEARYGVLNSVARNCLQGELITKNWDEFLTSPVL
jgi:hypothetical protein